MRLRQWMLKNKGTQPPGIVRILAKVTCVELRANHLPRYCQTLHKEFYRERVSHAIFLDFVAATCVKPHCKKRKCKSNVKLMLNCSLQPGNAMAKIINSEEISPGKRIVSNKLNQFGIPRQQAAFTKRLGPKKPQVIAEFMRFALTETVPTQKLVFELNF